MSRVVWKGYLYPNKKKEYVWRHSELWPELQQMFREAGIHNYTIWNHGLELFGYYECDDPVLAERVKRESPVMRRWSESMAGLMRLEQEPGKTCAAQFQQVFDLDKISKP